MSRSFAISFRAYLRDATGATAIEYALVASFVVLGIASAVQVMGEGVTSVYTQIAGFFDS